MLYLCEKPSQARDFARLLNAHQRHDGYLTSENVIVTWCLGHLLELAPPEHYINDLKPWRLEKLPIIPEKWTLIPNNKTKQQFAVIKKLLKTVNHVVIATDADREGDVIGREILEYCNYKGKIERLWISSLDDASIKKALADLKPSSFSEGLYHAGCTRRILDWLYGINFSMAATLVFTKRGDGVLSVGRVQSPTLRLVVDRDIAIEQFMPKEYYVIKAQFSDGKNPLFWTSWQIPEIASDEEGRCMNRLMAESIVKKLNGQSGFVETFEQIEEKVHSPLWSIR